MSIVVVAGSKGGVGATTIAGGLYRLAEKAVGIDLSATGDLARVMDAQAVSLSSLVRHRGRMPRQVETLLRRDKRLVSADLQATFYPDRSIEFLRLADRPGRMVIVDAGTEPSQAVLTLAGAILLVLAPDIRAIARADRMLGR